MGKEKFKRTNVKSTILKKIIIRFDFMGLTDVTGCANSLKELMDGRFNEFSPVSNNNYNIDLNKEYNQNHGFNVDLEKKTFYRFSKNEMGKSNAFFLLGDTFASIEIACDEDYEGCDVYINTIAEAVDRILKFDKFISVKRMGLRKIDKAVFNCVEQMEQAIEIPIWSNFAPNKHFLSIKKAYSDLIYQRDVNTIFNIKRIAQAVGTEDDSSFHFYLDIDSYKDGVLLLKDDFVNAQKIKKVLSEEMNEPLFNYFIQTFKEQYIESFYEE